MSIYIENPSGNRIGPLDEKLGPQRYRLGNTELLIYYGKPGPYHLTQEIYIDFLPVETYVDSGDWKIILSGKRVRGGEYYLWLPGGNTLNRGTGFYEPRAYGTLTIPATARRIIAVGAYDSLVDSYADFSGRGSRMTAISETGSGGTGSKHSCSRTRWWLQNSNRDFLCSTLCQRIRSIVNAMGDCKWKRSLSLWGKSKSLSPKRRQTIAGVRGVSQ